MRSRGGCAKGPAELSGPGLGGREEGRWNGVCRSGVGPGGSPGTTGGICCLVLGH